MLLLNSMTDAQPATRLILLTWAAHIELEAQPEMLIAIEAFGVSKREMKAALEYLEEAEYILWAKATKHRLASKVPKNCFDYALTHECLSMWQSSLDGCPWVGELLYLLKCPKSVKIKTKKKSNFTCPEKYLVLILLVAQANQAGYVHGNQIQNLSKMLGISADRLSGIIKDLTLDNLISTVASAVPSSKFFGELPPIYKFHPRRNDKKIIKLAVSLPDRSLDLIHVIENFHKFQSSIKKHPEKVQYPPETSELSYDEYNELSKIVECGDVVTTIHALCLSTILTLTPFYASALKRTSSAKSAENALEKLNEDLENLVFIQLGNGLPCRQLPTERSLASNDIQDDSLQKSSVVSLRENLIIELTREVSRLIVQLARKWNLFVSSSDIDGALLINYCPNTTMLVRLTDTLNSESESKIQHEHEHEHEDDDEDKQKVVQIYNKGVLAVQVPKDKRFKDCIIFDGELLMDGSYITGEHTRHINILVVESKRTVKT